MFPGVEGGPWQLRGAYNGLREAGVDAAIRVYDWQRWSVFGTLPNLMNLQRNRREAAGIAADITAYRDAHPTQPIDLIGYSGGGGIALMVAEALPADVRLRHIILVQAAVSPGYDLRAALEHVGGRLVNLYSPGDWVILGIGTTLFGTMDRRQGPSAGHVGFDLADAQWQGLEDRVEQRAWNLGEITTGHLGGHNGMRQSGWNRAVVAPYLLQDD